MRFTYEIFRDDGHTDNPKRIDTFTRHEEIKPIMFTWPNYLVISDNLGRLPDTIIKSQDDLDGWFFSREIAETWNRPNDKWDPFNEEETDIQMSYEPKTSSKELVDDNLKTAAAIGKPVTSPIPPIAILALGAAMNDGAEKYGRFNWRDSSVTSTVFYDAIMRHLLAWYSGEDYAPDSKVHHLAHVMAGCAILLDAPMHGVLNDNRGVSSVIANKETLNLLIKK